MNPRRHRNVGWHALGVLLFALLTFGTGCWSHTAMDLPIVGPQSHPTLGRSQRMLVAIQPTFLFAHGGNRALDTTYACEKPGGSFEKLLCRDFVAHLRTAGFLGETQCRIGPAPSGWQRNYDYLYSQKFTLNFAENRAVTIATYLLSLTTFFHSPFDVRVTSQGTLISARGRTAQLLQDDKHAFYVGSLGGVIPLALAKRIIEREVMPCVKD